MSHCAADTASFGAIAELERNLIIEPSCAPHAARPARRTAHRPPASGAGPGSHPITTGCRGQSIREIAKAIASQRPPVQRVLRKSPARHNPLDTMDKSA